MFVSIFLNFFGSSFLLVCLFACSGFLLCLCAEHTPKRIMIFPTDWSIRHFIEERIQTQQTECFSRCNVAGAERRVYLCAFIQWSKCSKCQAKLFREITLNFWNLLRLQFIIFFGHKHIQRRTQKGLVVLIAPNISNDDWFWHTHTCAENCWMKLLLCSHWRAIKCGTVGKALAPKTVRIVNDSRCSWPKWTKSQFDWTTTGYIWSPFRFNSSELKTWMTVHQCFQPRIRLKSSFTLRNYFSNKNFNFQRIRRNKCLHALTHSVVRSLGTAVM